MFFHLIYITFQRLQLDTEENLQKYRKVVTERDPVLKQELLKKWNKDRIEHASFVQRILDLATEAEERGVI